MCAFVASRLSIQWCWSQGDIVSCSRALLVTIIQRSLARNDLVDFCVVLSASQKIYPRPRRLTCEDVLERQLNVTSVEGRSLNER